MNPETRAALVRCSTATLTMQLLERRLQAIAMRRVKPLVAYEAWKQCTAE